MKEKLTSALVVAAVVMMGMAALTPANLYAEEENTEQTEEAAAEEVTTSIGITPLSKVLSLSSGTTYEDSFTVSNNGNADMTIETYAAPYSYVYSAEDEKYSLGFNNENNYTQIARWITFKDTEGNYVEKPTFTIAPNSALEIFYKITTPDSIPAGGQYAVLFAHTLTGVTSANGIKTEASPGILVYGRSIEGETIISAEISGMEIRQTGTDEEGNTRNLFNGYAKVKNTGNVDFNASGILRVDGILSGSHYETDSTSGRTSIIPEAELEISDEWEETPDFGLYKVTWTVTAGEETQTIERVICLIPAVAIVIFIICLTIIIVGLIIFFRKRKENRSRLAV